MQQKFKMGDRVLFQEWFQPCPNRAGEGVIVATDYKPGLSEPVYTIKMQSGRIPRRYATELSLTENGLQVLLRVSKNEG